DDYAYYLEYTRARIAVVDEALAPLFAKLARGAPHLRAVIVAGGDRTHDRPALQPGQHALLDLVAAAPDRPLMADTHRNDIAGWLFTSGSTGKPKAAVHFHEDFAFNIENYAKGVLGIRESDVTAGVPKLFFGYATGTNLMFPFAVGATTALFREQPTPELLFKLIEQHKATVFTSVPTLINKMLQAPPSERRDIASARLMWSAGEALPHELHERWDKTFGVPIIDGIGSAESFHIYISNRPGDIRPGSLGKLVPGYEARLVDDDSNPVAQGDVGTLWLKGDSAALYYQAAYEKSKEHLRVGWIVSGDKFRQDADGYWYYEGRGDDLLKSGGIYVSPHEVENCLMQHDAVRECCVIGKKDEHGLEKPLAIMV